MSKIVKMPWFPSGKPRKVEGRSTSPEGRAVLHQAVDESFISGQELRWAEEGLCMTEDSQSATGFGGEVEMWLSHRPRASKIYSTGKRQKV